MNRGSALASLLLLTLAVVFVSASADNVADDQPKLLFAAEVCRHGARSPVFIFPNDPNNLASWPEGLGQLTTSGMRQHYLIGRELRRRYVEQHKLLSPQFRVSEIYVRSTEYDRTIMSAQSQLAGLYPNFAGPSIKTPEALVRAVPPIQVQNLTEILTEVGFDAVGGRFQPIPIHVVPMDQDFVLRAYEGTVCPRLAEIWNDTRDSAEYKAKEKEAAPIMASLAKLAGLTPPVPLANAWIISDCLKSDQFEGRQLPPGFDQEKIDQIQALYDWILASEYSTKESHLLSSSNFFNELLTKLSDQVNGDLLDLQNVTIKHDPFASIWKTANRPPLRFAFYSAHDTTLAAFLSALNIFDRKNPPFASTLFFELYRKPRATSTADYYVRILFNDVSQLVPGCSADPCPFVEFSKVLADGILPDWKKACKMELKGLAKPRLD